MHRKVTSVVLLVIVLPCDTRVLPKSRDKFAFPPHLVGTNHSVSSSLKMYKDKYQPVDLGVDNVDDDAPIHIKEALINATSSGDPSVHQYTDSSGLPRLRRAIATMYSPLIGRRLNPDDNVLVTIGATAAVYSAIVGHTFAGDEWLIVEPAYNIYSPIVQQARGIAKFTSLTLKQRDGMASGEDWTIDKSEFEGLLGRRSKGIILNNPQNPIGKSLSLEELRFVGSMAKKYNLLIICDEAHEWVSHKPYVRIASLAGLYERTITVGTASKTFSLAGWRIGWAFGPKNLLNHAKTVHSQAVGSASVPQQQAIAYAFEEETRNYISPNSYFARHRRQVQLKRDFLIEAFVEAGLKPVVADGGYCMFVDWSPLRRNLPELGESLDFSIWMIENVGVLGLPGSSYYSEEHRGLGRDYARFCYHKKGETLEEAARRLKKLKRYLFY